MIAIAAWQFGSCSSMVVVATADAPVCTGPGHDRCCYAMQVAVRASAAAANIIGTEQPCRVRLRLWHCSAADPTAALEVPSLTIPDAVLCSEMGVHFSACGRYLAACVACQVRLCGQLPFKVAKCTACITSGRSHIWLCTQQRRYTSCQTCMLAHSMYDDASQLEVVVSNCTLHIV